MKREDLIIDQALIMKIENRFDEDFEDDFIGLNVYTTKELYDVNIMLLTPMVVHFELNDLKHIKCYYGLGVGVEQLEDTEDISFVDTLRFKDLYHFTHNQKMEKFDFKSLKKQLIDEGEEITDVLILSTTDNGSYEIYIGVKKC